MSTYESILERHDLNDVVCRIKTSAWEVDLHSSAYSNLPNGCTCTLSVSDTQNKKADIVMRGRVFSKQDSWRILSCGGLMCKVSDAQLVVGKDYFVNLTIKKPRGKRKATD